MNCRVEACRVRCESSFGLWFERGNFFQFRLMLFGCLVSLTYTVKKIIILHLCNFNTILVKSLKRGKINLPTFHFYTIFYCVQRAMSPSGKESCTVNWGNTKSLKIWSTIQLSKKNRLHRLRLQQQLPYLVIEKKALLSILLDSNSKLQPCAPLNLHARNGKFSLDHWPVRLFIHRIDARKGWLWSPGAGNSGLIPLQRGVYRFH